MSRQDNQSPPAGTPIPRGVDVLVKKASIDPAFKKLLLARRAEAAEEIALALNPAEAMMLRAVPEAQLETIIAQTSVPQEHRRAFLGKAAAAMLAALSAAGPAVAVAGKIRGPTGIAPDRPPVISRPVLEERVIAVVASQTGFAVQRISQKTRFADKLRASPKQREAIRKALQKEFRITIAGKTFEEFRTVGQVVEYVQVRVPLTKRVVQIVARELKLGKNEVSSDTLLTKPRKLSEAQLVRLRRELSIQFHVPIVWVTMKRLQTISEIVDVVEDGVKRLSTLPPPPSPEPAGIRPDRVRPSRGVRPDRPSSGRQE